MISELRIDGSNHLLALILSLVSLVTNHPYLFELTNPDFQTNYVVGPDLIRSSGKFDLLHRMIPKLIQSGHKILLFSQMTKVLDLIEDYCRWKLIKFVRLDGSSMSDVRSKAQDDFNAPGSDIHLFLMSTRAGGLGLNLQVADTVILFDSDWNVSFAQHLLKNSKFHTISFHCSAIAHILNGCLLAFICFSLKPIFKRWIALTVSVKSAKFDVFD